ncbi:M23 family metallopeptidase [Candidatus Uhrbacteria bacterium]|nr:M23 family metallopeptidase [Candidatus Uhrbacteria bacterium]
MRAVIKKYLFGVALLGSIALLGAGCVLNSTDVRREEQALVLPVPEYEERITLKIFGEYIQDRFVGIHLADDVEFTDEASLKRDIPVYAIADGVVLKKLYVSGYGGYLLLEHVIQDETYRAIYGHVDLASVSVEVGDRVEGGQQIAILGDHRSTETDGERKHLHFGLYDTDDERIAGYAPSLPDNSGWLNPYAFFVAQGILDHKPERRFPNDESWESYAHLQFTVPEGFEVEYVPSIDALNVFALNGEGTARERSQIFIRYFDARAFQTLSTVNIESQSDLTVGKDGYVARRYLHH